MCGCLSKKNVTKNRAIKSSTISTRRDIGCMNMYEELKNIDLVIIKILKENKDSILIQANKQLRKWINNLNIKCPNEYEINVIKEYINNEYSEYNT
ncbi:MAG: hypothetical protein KC414_09260 [Romboutsia sp.]|nr:hypothetical protein [Romboutsia sp.]